MNPDREPLPVERLATPDERRTSSPATDRSESLRIISRLVGDAGVQSFLKCRQPALGDRTGGELLQHDPGELLKRLRWLEADRQSFHDDELVADPLVERYAQQRKKSQGDRLLELLDELDRSAHE
jgi:hypothetical protein